MASIITDRHPQASEVPWSGLGRFEKRAHNGVERQHCESQAIHIQYVVCTLLCCLSAHFLRVRKAFSSAHSNFIFVIQKHRLRQTPVKFQNKNFNTQKMQFYHVSPLHQFCYVRVPGVVVVTHHQSPLPFWPPRTVNVECSTVRSPIACFHVSCFFAPPGSFADVPCLTAWRAIVTLAFIARSQYAVTKTRKEQHT